MTTLQKIKSEASGASVVYVKTTLERHTELTDMEVCFTRYGVSEVIVDSIMLENDFQPDAQNLLARMLGISPADANELSYQVDYLSIDY